MSRGQAQSIFVGLVGLAIGVAIGWVARGAAPASGASAAGEPSGDSTSEIAIASRLADGAVRSGAASSPEDAIARGEANERPRGQGEVAVIGGEGGGGAGPGSSAGQRSDQGSGATARGGDAGRPRGTLDRNSIRDVVSSHRDELGFCFAWQLHSRPELGGRLTMELTIGTDGQVTEARVADDQLGDETVARCFRNVTQRMRFPAPEGGEVQVRYPFILSPGDAPADAGVR